MSFFLSMRASMIVNCKDVFKKSRLWVRARLRLVLARIFALPMKLTFETSRKCLHFLKTENWSHDKIWVLPKSKRLLWFYFISWSAVSHWYRTTSRKRDSRVTINWEIFANLWQEGARSLWLPFHEKRKVIPMILPFKRRKNWARE